MELRCDNKLFGVWIPELGAFEVKCNAGHCGKERGVVVLHRFFLDGRSMQTLRFREPPKGGERATHQDQLAVRHEGHRSEVA